MLIYLKLALFFTVHSKSGSSALKAFNLVHQGIQISRYIEIFYDKEVTQEVRHRTIFYIKRLLAIKPNVIWSIKKIIINFIIFSQFSNEKIEENIADLKYAGFTKTSLILYWLHNSKIAKILSRLLMGKLYKNLIIRKQSKMMLLQKGIYKKHFDYVNQD